ncbi:hypothetical protein [Streptomyces tendae]
MSEFTADVPRSRQFRKIMAQIEDITKNARRQFEEDISATIDWPGQDDSTAKEYSAYDKKVRTQIVQTADGLTGGVEGIGEGLGLTGNSIQRTQNDIIDMINNSNNTGKH